MHWLLMVTVPVYKSWFSLGHFFLSKTDIFGLYRLFAMCDNTAIWAVSFLHKSFLQVAFLIMMLCHKLLASGGVTRRACLFDHDTMAGEEGCQGKRVSERH